MNIRYSLLGLVGLSLALAACGSGTTGALPAGGSSGPPPGSPVSQAVSPATGGTVTMQFSGGGSAAVTIPAGALSQSSTVTLAGVTTAAALPKTFSSAARKTQSVPSGSTFLIGFTLDLGGATLLKPVQITETFSGVSVPSGNVVRLAMYSTKVGSYTDVDTATGSGSTVSNNLTKGYVGISSGTGAANPYAFYAVPAASAATPAPISLSVAESSASPIPLPSGGGTAVYTASGADANGNPYAYTPAFAATSGWTVTPSTTNPMQATVTAGVGPGTLTVTDATQNLSTQVALFSQHPGGAGLTFNYTGTLARNDTYSYPAPTLPPSSATANVSQAVTTNGVATSPFSSGSAVDFNTVEKDAYPLQTLTTTSDLYFAPSFSTFSLLGYKSADDVGDTANVQYTTPQIVDELPESSGTSWTNSPAATETDVFTGNETANRTTASDGSYADKESIFASTSGTPSYPRVDSNLTENPDGSAVFSVVKYENGRGAPYVAGEIITQSYLLSAPTAGQITLSTQFIDYKPPAPMPTPTPQVQGSFPAFYSGPLYSETDKNLGVVTIPTSCNVPSVFGTTGSQIQQQVTSNDAVMGTTTVTTTNQYIVPGFGPVCVTLASNVQAFYDYNIDTLYGLLFPNPGTAPPTALQNTTIAETLTMSAPTVGTHSVGRTTASLSPIAPGAIAVARVHLQSVLRKDRAKRLQRMIKTIVAAAEAKGAR